MKSCSFTGHRSIDTNDIKTLPDLIRRGIEYVYNLGVRRFCVGGALGFDTMAAKEVIRFRMTHPDCELVLVLPCLNQTDNWTNREKEMYDFILSEADLVEYTAEHYYSGCMRVRNRRLVELADVVIAYLKRQPSGAAQTVKMAKEAGKTVYNLYGKK